MKQKKTKEWQGLTSAVDLFSSTTGALSTFKSDHIESHGKWEERKEKREGERKREREKGKERERGRCGDRNIQIDR